MCVKKQTPKYYEQFRVFGILKSLAPRSSELPNFHYCQRIPDSERCLDENTGVNSIRHVKRWVYWYKNTQKSSPQISDYGQIIIRLSCTALPIVRLYKRYFGSWIYYLRSTVLIPAHFITFPQFWQQEHSEHIRSSINDFQVLPADPTSFE